MRLIKRILILILPLLLLLPLLPAAEAQSVDTSQTTQLDILYEYGGTPIANAQVHIYRVGSIGSSGSASLQLPYSAYPIDPGLLSSGEYPQAAKLLYHYILLNKKTPDKILITDENGEAQGNLDTGLFLIVPQKFSDYRGIFRSEPALVSLPYRASTGEPWSYQVTYMPKCAFTPKNRIGERSLYVTKKWQLDSEEDRPKEITVYLLRDQTILEQVKLNAANRWLYRWDELSENYDWRVVEKPVSGYTVTMSGNAGSVLLTNTGDGDIPIEPDETISPTETTEATESTEETEAAETTETTENTTSTESGSDETTRPTTNSPGSGKPSRPSRPKLPQTGLLWWPVPLLLFLGFALIFLGMRIVRGAMDEE